MFLSDLKTLDITPLEEDIPIMSSKTSYEDLPLNEVDSAKVKYPSARKCRRYNNHKLRLAKARITKTIYFKLIRRLNRMSEEDKAAAKEKIRALRPSLATLRKYYLDKGDTAETVRFLVTPENYPNLKKVWITKQQQEVLIDIVDGNAAEHQAFIENGFY